jgi:hypothetical protein
MPSQPFRGGRQKVGSSLSRHSSSSAWYFPYQEEDGGFDYEVDPPPSDALFVTGLRMHLATVSRGHHEPLTDFSSKGVNFLQKIRFINPILIPDTLVSKTHGSGIFSKLIFTTLSSSLKTPSHPPPGN